MPAGHERPVSNRRYLIFWVALAVLALVALAGVLIRQDRHTLLRWSVFLSTNPQEGSTVFRQKGCIHCHAVNGVGGKIGPDLGAEGGLPSGLAFLVSAMWNHAPRMWARMRAEHFSYPTLTYEETAQLVAFLYMANHMDGPGDAQRGRLLFASKGCSGCHTLVGKDGVAGSGAATSLMAWTGTLWNHAPAMQDAMRKAGEAWPKLEGSDLNDLFAYVRESGGQPDAQSQPFPVDPERGWQVFQAASCNSCHSLKAQEPGSRADLPPENWPARTFAQLGELMWNHAPGMLRAMRDQGLAHPQFTGKEMTDLMGFVYSLRYYDPPGSAAVGKSVFAWRSCSQCHGEAAQGTSIAPALRGRGRNYNSISLATALWLHGQKMFRTAQQTGVGWPTLEESDIGDLLAFLNSPVEPSRPQNQK
jgi:mono/diheme cytochrome c family protein